MNKHVAPLPALLALALSAAIAPAAAQTPAVPAHVHDQSRLSPGEDPFKPVFIVTSRATYDAGVKTLAKNSLGVQNGALFRYQPW